MVSPHKISYKQTSNSSEEAAYFICKDYQRLSSDTPMLSSLDMKPISYVHAKMRLLMVYKILHKLVKLPLPS